MKPLITIKRRTLERVEKAIFSLFIMACSFGLGWALMDRIYFELALMQ